MTKAHDLLRSDLLSDEDEIRDKRKQLSDLRDVAWKPQLRAASMFHPMEEIKSRRRNRASTYKDRRHTSDWLPTAYSIYPSSWRIASSSSMQNARLPPHRRTAPVVSPFVILPRHIRAIAPHQGHEWWNIHPGNPRRDFIQVRTCITAISLHLTNKNTSASSSITGTHICITQRMSTPM